MTEIRRTALFGKLNRLAYKAIENATVFCKMRGNPYVELAHWIHQLLQLQDSDLHRLIQGFDLEPARVAQEVTEALDRLPRGASAVTDLSSHVEEAVERGWVYGTLMFGESQVRTGHLIVGLLKTPSLRHVLSGISREFDKLKADALTERFHELVAGSPEEGLKPTDGFQVASEPEPGKAAEEGAAPAPMGKQEALKRFTVDLTEQARADKIDPVIGRDDEIRQVVDILMRRRQNNPLLTGEAGVGKTAVVEGFARRLARGDVPPSLREVALKTLDLGLLQAGASMKGEFENRLKQLIEEVQSAARPIILFIDEAHTLIGAGGGAGSSDAANLLKPALARGNLRTIAATTWGEYKKHIEKDPALTRRFQVVPVEEPDEEQAVVMVRGLASTTERHHRVQVLDEALEAAVGLSHRYIPARQLPDKAVSLLDTAAARVAISQYAVPAEVEDCRHQIEALETETQIIDREEGQGLSHDRRRHQVAEALEAERQRLEGLEQRWSQEQDLVNRILDLQAQLGRQSEGMIEGKESALEEAVASESRTEAIPAAQEVPPAATGRSQVLDELQGLQQQLATLQGERPLILPSVDAQAVASVVADWTGIPVGRMVRNEVAAVLRLSDALSQRVLGQRHALETIARRIQTSRAHIDHPGKPTGVFLLTGPSGVGKTETALALAEALYGGEHNMVTLNMSEFQEAHTVSTLKGAPPGYVGYGEGGVLTEAVRRRPYSVVLLDEVEKAHRDVHEIFFQVFDKGQMEDGEGRLVDFKNTVILLTTNVGTELIMGMCQDPELMPDADGLAKALREPLRKVFPAALLGRLAVVPYYPLSDEMLQNIVRFQLDRIAQRITANYEVPFTYDDDVVALIANRCTEVESGARVVDAILTNTVLPRISEEILSRTLEGRRIGGVHVQGAEGGFAYRFD